MSKDQYRNVSTVFTLVAMVVATWFATEVWGLAGFLAAVFFIAMFFALGSHWVVTDWEKDHRP